MSRHTAPTVGFGKLKLEDSVSPSSQKRGLSGKSSSSSSGRKTAASHATRSLTGSRSSRTTSTSGAHSSAGPSRAVRPSTISQRVHQDDSDDTDGNERNDANDCDDTSDSDDPGGQSNAIIENNFRIAELMACGTDNNLTSVQIIPSTSDTPEQLSPVTVYLSRFAQNFAAAQLSTNQHIVNNLMNGIPRDLLITQNIANFWLQIQRIFQELRNHINDDGGRDHDGTVTEITKWQRAVGRFVSIYQSRSWLTNDQRTNLYSLAIWTIHSIVQRNLEDESGVFRTGDLHPGNLYQKWRIAGRPEVLFWTLGHLRDRKHALPEDYRNLLVYDRARLQEWRAGPTGEEALDDGPIVSVLMEAAW